MACSTIVRLTFSPPLHIRRRAALPVRERLSRLSGGCQWFPALHLHHTSVLSPTCYQPTHSAAGDGHYLKFLRYGVLGKTWFLVVLPGFFTYFILS